MLWNEGLAFLGVSFFLKMEEKSLEKSATDLKSIVTSVAEKYGVLLKDKQLEAIMAFISGHDVFVTLPTGYGKSLIFALLPWIYDKINGKRQLYLCHIKNICNVVIHWNIIIILEFSGSTHYNVM